MINCHSGDPEWRFPVGGKILIDFSGNIVYNTSRYLGVGQLLSGCCRTKFCLQPISADRVGSRAHRWIEHKSIFPGVAQLVGRLVWVLEH